MSGRWGKEYFDEKFEREDPWEFFTSDYEQRKYRRQIDVIKDHISGSLNAILEVGCAEGVHTRMLAKVFPYVEITGLDISSVES
ncbi:MAG TPA: class I SAM-dependent methyltransferase [Desulfobacteria bacterium]|nr:class I SAM-dependent methyltransferase [Desulfobacteria bacterium]